MNTIRAISLTEPWATLVVCGIKRIETRSWSTGFRGTLAVHAAQKFPPCCRDLCRLPPFREALAQAGVDNWTDLTPTLGHVLGTVRLVHAFQFDARNVPPSPERDFGDYRPGRWGLVLEDPKRLAAPVKARGSLSIWTWTPPAWPLLHAGERPVPTREAPESATGQLGLFA